MGSCGVDLLLCSDTADREDSVFLSCSFDPWSRSDLGQMSGCPFTGRSPPAGEKVMADDEFTCDLFRFLQLLCEGHNNGESPSETRGAGNDGSPSAVFSSRLPELPADSDWQHHHHQHHHLYGGLPPAAAGTQRRRPPLT